MNEVAFAVALVMALLLTGVDYYQYRLTGALQKRLASAERRLKVYRLRTEQIETMLRLAGITGVFPEIPEEPEETPEPKAPEEAEVYNYPASRPSALVWRAEAKLRKPRKET